MGLIHAIMMVFVFPPRESFNILVSLLSRYGIWLIVFFLEFSAKVLIQFPKASKLLLIFAPYCIFLLQFKVCNFYEPAKSMIYSLETVLSKLDFSTSTINCSIAWEREEYWLATVDANALLAFPKLIYW